MTKKQKEVSTILNYSEHYLILVFSITECISNFTFVSLVGIPIGSASSEIGLKFNSKTATTKKNVNEKLGK